MEVLQAALDWLAQQRDEWEREKNSAINALNEANERYQHANLKHKNALETWAVVSQYLDKARAPGAK